MALENQAVNYMAKIGVDGSEFTSGIQSMTSQFMTTFGPSGMLIGAIAGVTAALVGNVVEQGKMAQGIRDLTEATGVTTDAIQRFHYAAKLSGDSLGTVDVMLNKLTLSLGEAKEATSAQAKAFNELGVSPDGKTTEQVFTEIATKLTAMEDKQKAASIASDLLGKSYKEMLPYMKNYLLNAEFVHPNICQQALLQVPLCLFQSLSSLLK